MNFFLIFHKIIAIDILLKIPQSTRYILSTQTLAIYYRHIQRKLLKPKSYKCFGSRLAEIVNRYFPEFKPDPDRGTFMKKNLQMEKIRSKNIIYFFTDKTNMQAPEEASSPQGRA
jgi:hypothetical protein